jgi:hypothetical protein
VLESIKPELEAVKMASVKDWQSKSSASNIRIPTIWNGKEGFDSERVISLGGIITEL